MDGKRWGQRARVTLIGLMTALGATGCGDQVQTLGLDCEPGYSAPSCRDIDECTAFAEPCGPGGVCANLPGSFVCACEEGFIPSGTELGCIDRDECIESERPCGPNGTCINRVGSFECLCNEGFELASGACRDIDECTVANDCSPQAICLNLEGAYECRCNPGFEGSGFECIDVDECAAGTANCDVNATCQNIPGTFACNCRDGYTGNGVSCVDVNECVDGTSDCAPEAECINQPGAFSCRCRDGFTGNGRQCQDIDECANGSANCDVNASCTNQPGGFECRCNPGFTGNGFACQGAFDIELVFAQNPSATVRQAFDAAERRWESLITSDLADIPSVPAGCDAPSGVTSIDDLVIGVSIEAIDGAGNILGQAGPRCVRGGSGFLPFVGQMRFDSADISQLISRGLLNAVVLHEMGHVLGLGPGWRSRNLLLNPSCPNGNCTPGRDTRYLGSQGSMAWQSLGGSGRPPVENSLGPGSSDGHWREDSGLRDELMSPRLSGSSALSIVTLRSLVDLGYTVTGNAAADPFILSSILAPGAVPPPEIELHDDILPGPVYVLTPTGLEVLVP